MGSRKWGFDPADTPHYRPGIKTGDGLGSPPALSSPGQNPGAEKARPVEPRERDEAWLKLKARLDLARGPGDVDEAALDARITADPKDFEARFALATLHAQRQAWSAAFAQLLEIVLRDKADARKQARDKLVEWFPLCPDPKAVTTARRELSMYLN